MFKHYDKYRGQNQDVYVEVSVPKQEKQDQQAVTPKLIFDQTIVFRLASSRLFFAWRFSLGVFQIFA
jgi:hypothetical protein